MNRDLLLKDLCARVPYGVRLNIGFNLREETLTPEHLIGIMKGEIQARPYLRSFYNMTEEEKRELQKKYVVRFSSDGIRLRYHSEGYWDNDLETFHTDYLWLEDWLLSRHFDYRGLIEKGLAIEAPAGIYE